MSRYSHLFEFGFCGACWAHFLLSVFFQILCTSRLLSLYSVLSCYFSLLASSVVIAISSDKWTFSFIYFFYLIVNCRLCVVLRGKTMIPMCRLWLHDLYGLHHSYGHSDTHARLLIHSLTWSCHGDPCVCIRSIDVTNNFNLTYLFGFNICILFFFVLY